MAKKKFADLANACWKGYKAVGLKDKNGRKVPNCVPEETQMEELKGKQHKIDKNKNGKIDAQDFKILQKEEEETVDRVERSDYKVSPSGRKSHKQIVFKMGDEELKEEDDYSKRHTVVAHVSDNTGTPADGEKREVIKKALSVLAATPKHAEAAARKYFADKGYKVHKIAAKLKEEVEQQDEATYDYKKAMQSQNPRIQKKGIGGAMDNAAKRIQQTIKDVPLNSLEKRYKEEVEELEEATVSKKDYSWGKMMTVHHGKDTSYPLHPEHQKIVKDLRPTGEHSKAMYKDETGKQVHVTREGDKVHFVSHRTSGSKKTTVDYKHFDESVPAKNTDVSDKSWLKDAGKKPSIKSDLKNFKNFLMGKKETNEEVEQVMEAAPFKTKEDAVKYAKEKVKTHRDNLDGIEIYAHSGGFDVNHTMNASGRNSLQKIKAKHLGTIYKEETEQVEEGWYEKPASAYRRKGDEIGGGSSKNDVPFDGPYKKIKPAKNSDGTPQAPMSLARQLAKDAMKKQRNEEVELEEGSYNNPHKSVAAEIKAGTFKSYSPTAPVPDKKYIKGTPENKAYKATKKPINGHPTNEEVEQIDELDTKTLKSYINKNIKSGDTSSNRDEGLYTATNKVAKRLATSTLDKKVKTLGNKRPSETKNRFEYDASRSELKNRGIHHFAGRRTRTEEFDDNGELITNMKSYKEFLESLDEVKMSDLPSRKVSGKYGTEYYKGEAEKDVKGYDDEDTPAKPAGEKRGRGRPAGSTSGARQKGTIAKRKGSGVEMTGYPVHLPNFK